MSVKTCTRLTALLVCLFGSTALSMDVGIEVPKFFSPTREVVTPHIAWANPYSKGTLRVLFIGMNHRMREAVEIAQRLDVEETFFYLFRNKGKSIFYKHLLWGGHIKGTAPEDRTEELKAALRSDYDLFVFGAFDWRALPIFAKYEILKQVKQGAGLIKATCGPYGGLSDEYLNLATKDRIEIPLSVAAGVPWKALPVFSSHETTRSFLDSVFRASRLGKGRIVRIHGYLVPEMHLVSPGFSTTPLTYNWMRTIPISQESRSPEFTMPMTDVKRLDYDYYLAFIIRLCLYAAGKLPDVTIAEDGAVVHDVPRHTLSDITFSVDCETGDAPPALLNAEFTLRNRDNDVLVASTKPTLRLTQGQNRIAFPVPPVPAGEYFADLWIRKHDRVVSFGSKALRISAQSSIRDVRLGRDHFRAEETIKGTVEIEPGVRPLSDLRLVVRQKDNLGRLVREEERDVNAATIRFEFPPIPSPLTVYQYLDIALVADRQVLDRKRTPFTLSNLYPEDAIRFGTWASPITSYISMLMHDQLYRRGVDSTSMSYDHDGQKFNYHGLNTTIKQRGRPEIPVLSNLRFIAAPIRIRDHACYNACFDGAPGLGAKKIEVVEGIRLPCLNDPVYRDKLNQRLKYIQDYCGRFSTCEYLFNDEMTFAASRRDDDETYDKTELCFSPRCKTYFRNYLEEQYGTLAALNAEYESSYTSFEQIEPVKLSAVRKDPRLAPLWADFRMAMEKNYAGIFEMSKKTIQSTQPEARVGYDCSFGTHCQSWSANEVWKASRWADIFQPYDDIFGSKARIDFALPGALGGAGYFWGYVPNWSREFTTMILWDQLFRGARFFFTYWGDVGQLLAGDLSLFEASRPLFRNMEEIKKGIGKLIHESRRETGSVALLYSVPSTHQCTLTEGTLRTRTMKLNYIAWTAMLTDANLAFRVISNEQLAQGILDKGGVNVLIMPQSMALSPQEVSHIKRFAKRGGTVLADVRPGVSDGHCKPYKNSPLDEIFGVIQDTGHADIKEALVEIVRPQGKERLGMLDADCSLKIAAGGTAAGSVQGTVPALITRHYGEGKGILLNFSLAPYVVHKDLIAGMRIPYVRSTPELLSFLEALFAGIGIPPPITYGPKLDDLRLFRFHSGRSDYLGLMQELPESVGKYAGGTAEPLTEKKTTLHLTKPAHVYAARQGRYMGFTDEITTFVKPGHALVFALLPYRVESMTVSAPSTIMQGDAPAYEVEIAATATPEKHVVHIALTGPDGETLRHYSENVSVTGGRYSGRIRLALNETVGTYALSVRDAATGTRAETKIVVAQRGVHE